MSQEVIALNPCLQKLQNEGFKVEIRGAFLLVHHVPYLNKNSEVKDGLLVMTIVSSGRIADYPEVHTAFLAGEIPIGFDGKPNKYINKTLPIPKLSEDVQPNIGFSRMPDDGMYKDYYEKVIAYTKMLSGPAEAQDPIECERIRNLSFEVYDSSPFVYPDTNSGRAGITGLTERFNSMKVAIVGVGGTGSYVLDKVVKVPVKEIHLFDDDVFMNHNAYRAPGAASLNELEKKPLKVDYFAAMYSKMRTGIVVHPVKITPQNDNLLDGFDFVFICVDCRDARESIAYSLVEKRIPFIDSGMGAEVINDKLLGIVRTTMSFGANYGHLKHCFASDGSSEDIYSSSIQIAELNSLAADLAVIRWKRFVGFYKDEQCELNSLYSFSGNVLTNARDD